MRLIKLLVATLLWAAILLCLAVTLVPPFLDRVYYQGPVSAHFDGQRFFNADGSDTEVPAGRRNRILTRRLFGDPDQPAWPERVAVTPARPEARVSGDRMTVTWVGHATALVQAGGMNILTDPIWSTRAGPFGIGPGRVAAPGIRFEDLPRIDLVLISHNHYDHMDLATLKRLWERDRPTFVTSLGNDTLLHGVGIPARCPSCQGGTVALDWGGQVRTTGAAGAAARVTVVRTHHWGSRWFVDRNRALWSGFVADTPAGSLFFAGDTGLGDGRWASEARAAAAGPIRLALIPIGAFRFDEGEMGIGSHIGPEGAIRVWRDLGQPFAVPIHWGTFRLSREGYETPPRLLAAMLACAGADSARFHGQPIGRSIAVPQAAPAGKRADLAAIRRCEEEGKFAVLR